MAKEETAGTEGTGEEKTATPKEKTKVKKAKPAKAEKAAATKHNKGVWGLDLGQCGLKAIRLEERDGQVVATHFDYIEHAKILSQPDADKDALIREALETFLKRNSWKGDHLAIAVPGKSGLVRFVKLPPVEEKRIKDIVAFEARQQIPFSLEEVVWDFQKLGQGMVIEGMAIDTEIGLFAMKRDAIQRELQSYKDASMEVHTIQMSPLALANYLIYDQLKKDPPTGKQEDDDGSSSSNRCIAALDVGADESTLVVTNGGKTIMQRPVNIGGNHFTRALTKDLKLTFAKAEHIKRNATKGVGKDGPDLKTILAALKPVYSDFVNELQRALTYFSNTNRSAEITHLVGLGNAFKLPGLQKYLQEKLQIQVNLPESFERLDTREVDSQATFKDNLLSYAVAYGLGLQGLNKGTLKVNLLPPEIRFERMIRAKKPMAAAAAALLLLGLGGMAWRNYIGAKPYIDSRVIAEVDSAKKAKSTVDAGKSAYDNAVKATEDEKRKVESSVAGQQERLNWLELYSFVNEALPHADGTNLYSADAKPYFEGWRVPWTEWEKEIQAAPGPMQTKLKKDREQLATEWSAFFKVQPQQLTLLPLPANPLPDQKLETVHDQYTRARAAKQDFFRKMRGVDAYNLYANQRGLVRETAQGSNLPAGIADLPMVNIEAVNCRYTDKLDTFWTAAKADPAFKTSMNDWVRPASHVKTALEGAGWVVELRGYTFHWDAQNFLNKTLVENLALHGIRPKVIPVTPAQLAAGAKAAPAPMAVATSTPMPTPMPGMAPAASGTAGAQPAEGGMNPMGASPMGEGAATAEAAGPPPNAGPVVNRVSHVMLFAYALQDTSDRVNLSIAASGMLASLMGGGAGGGGGMAAMMGKGMMMGGGPSPGGEGGGDASGGAAGGSKRDAWVPIGGTGSASTGGGGMGGAVGVMGEGGPGAAPGGRGGPPKGMGGGAGGKAGMGPGAMPGMGGMPGMAGMGGMPGSSAGQTSSDRRTEFVVFFVWREPTPSDGLRHMLDASGGGEGGAAAASDGGATAGESAKLYSEKADPAAIRPDRPLPLQPRKPGLPASPEPPPPIVERAPEKPANPEGGSADPMGEQPADGAKPGTPAPMPGSPMPPATPAAPGAPMPAPTAGGDKPMAPKP